MLKVSLLLATASTHRVSEIHVLCIDPPFLMQNAWSFHLAPNPAFLPKTSMEVSLSSDLEITACYPEPTSPLERGFHLICPVHTLRIYPQCTERIRASNRFLFVH